LAPSWNGQYIAILPPATCYDLMRDTQWVDAARYAGSRQIFKGEVGEYMGVRVVETTNPYEVNVAGYDNNEAIGPVYANIVTGKGAYGVPRLTGKNAFSSPYRPTLLINDQPDKADPLNQFITVGWKAYYNAMLLNPNWVTSIVARTQFSG
jgi:N4-gp56 family major capsid protein